MRAILVIVLVVAAEASAARPFRKGAVATEHPIATEAALSMLDKGGNAVDAAVAAAFALGVVSPFHSGIGGGGFALVWDAKAASASVLDFREVAPKAAFRDMYLKDGKVVPKLSTDGALSVAVPGAAMGYLELLQKHGKLKPPVVLAPAIAAAKKGFWVTPKYARVSRERLDCLKADDEAARIFLAKNPLGQLEPKPLGSLVKQPDLARTLEALARSGPKAFYEGKVARAIEETMKAKGGLVTMADLAAYKTRWRAPLESSYRGHRLLTMPPPSAGGIAIIQVLGALEQLPNGLPSREVDVVHRYIEAVRRAYVGRAKYLGDPAFTEIPMDRLVSPGAIAELVKSIDPAKATPSIALLPQTPLEPVQPPRTLQAPVERPRLIEGKKNTAHISVIDEDGNAVALTTTVNYWFGSCVVARGTGVLLNDQMDDFAAAPGVPNTYGLVTGEANAIAPGKVPLSSMAPTLVFHKNDPKRVMLAVGTPGGSTIPTTIIQVISNVVDGPMDVVRAVGAWRIHHQYLPDEVTIEPFALEPETRKALEEKGHRFNVRPFWGDAEAVMVDPDTGLFTAASDPRNEGWAAGRD